MERVTLKEYEAAKAAVLYGKEYEEISDMENNVIHKQYVCKDGSGTFYERTEDGVTEFWSTEHSKSRLYVDKVENKPAHEEKEELSESRQKAIKRMYKLVYWFADEMLKEEDAEKREAAEFERQCKEEPDKLQFRVSAHDNNAKVMKDCMREARDAAEFLKDRENDIEEWQIAGINAMCDQCNVEKVIPYDLPTAIKGLARIAAGETVGDDGDGSGSGTQPTLLRSFAGAGGTQPKEPEDKYDTAAYRKAFMNYVCRGATIPAEFRAAETTTTADSGAVIPTSIMNEIIQKLESYGSIYAQVRKINVQGGVAIPIADLKPTAHWITEEKNSDDQKASAKNSVTFNYYGLECKISQSILANVVTLKMFTDLFIPMATEAMVKAIEIAIFNGTGEGQPLGVLKDARVLAVVELTEEEYASWKGWHKVKGKIKKAYRNGSFIMNQSTFDAGIDGMEDKNGQPIGRTNYGINGEESYRFMGKTVETVEDEVLPSWDDAEAGDVFAVFMKLSDYVINTNMEMQVTKWTDHDNNKIKNKCLMVVDGKAADTNGIILIKKAIKAV